jgi:hypothetical protein
MIPPGPFNFEPIHAGGTPALPDNLIYAMVLRDRVSSRSKGGLGVK